MVYALTFAGVPFRVLDAETMAAVSARYPFALPTDDTRADPDGPWSADPNKTFAGPAHGPAREVRVGEFYYPPHASRFACFRGLMHADDVALAMTATGGGTSPQTFVMNSGDDGRPVSTNLYLLPPQPVVGVLTETAPAGDLFLVTLVDERYFWREKAVDTTGFDWFAPAVADDPTSATLWTDYFALFAAGLAVTIDPPVPEISPGVPGLWDTDGLRPPYDSPLRGAGDKAPAVLDLAAASCGLTLCRRYDGTYKLVYTGDALVSALTARTAAAAGYRAGGSPVFSVDPSIYYDAGRVGIVAPANYKVSAAEFIQPDPEDGTEWPAVPAEGDGVTFAWPPATYSETIPQVWLPTNNGRTVTLWTALAARYLDGDYPAGPLVEDPTTWYELFAGWHSDSAVYHLDEVYTGVESFDPLAAADVTVAWGEDTHTRVTRWHNEAEWAFVWQDYDNFERIQGDPAPLVGFLDTGTVNVAKFSSTVGTDQQIRQTVIIALPKAGTYQLALFVRGGPNSAGTTLLHCELYESPYVGGPAAGSVVFLGAGADNTNVAAYNRAEFAATLQTSGSSGSGFEITTYVRTTEDDCRIGFFANTFGVPFFLYGKALPAPPSLPAAANYEAGTTVTAVRLEGGMGGATAGGIDLATVTGILAPANGGTGVNGLPAGEILLGDLGGGIGSTDQARVGPGGGFEIGAGADRWVGMSTASF